MAGKRRGRNEGTIGHHASGLWYGRVDQGIVNGKRKRVCVYGKTRDEVRRKMGTAQRQVDAGDPVTPARLTVERYLLDWLETSAKPRVRPRTFVGYDDTIRRILIPGIGAIRLGKLTPGDVERWMDQRQHDGGTAHSCAYARTVLRAALSDAVRRELVSRNVASLVKPPKVSHREISPLTPEQARALLKAVSGTRDEALFTVAVALGLRMGEILGLRWEDVDLAGNVIHVRQAWQRVGGDRALRRTLTKERQGLLAEIKTTTDPEARRGLATKLIDLRKRLRAEQTKVVFVAPKSRRSRRTVNLPPVVADSLKAHQTRQLEERLRAGRYWQPSGLVFVNTIGGPMEERAVGRTLRSILTRAGLPPVRMHDLRHTAATLLLTLGVDARTIMAVLGHSQISLTLDTYAHVLPALETDAAAKMNAVLSAG